MTTAIDCNLSLGSLVVTPTSILCGDEPYPFTATVNAFGSFSSDSTTGIEMLNRAVDIHLSSVTLTCALPIQSSTAKALFVCTR
jgi:hypothetical protein